MPNIVSRRAIIKRPEKIKRTLTLGEFYEKRNKVLIIRSVGGLGDIFMHRMIFEDIKRLMPDCEIHFACPMIYHDAIKDHPFIDKVLSSEKIEPRDYIAHYRTTTICGRTEMKLAPASAPHRSDIWANHCGLTLKNHDMHISFTKEELAAARGILKNYKKPIAAICPISAIGVKNLLPHQLRIVVEELQKRNISPMGLHNHPILELEELDVPSISTSGRLRLWMALLHEVDYAICVDTAAFHCAGGMGKPTLGVFTFVNGLAYGQYYPKAEIIQGPCPLGYAGCYNLSLCPKKDLPKPCLEGITNTMITEGIDRLFQRFPTNT